LREHSAELTHCVRCPPRTSLYDSGNHEAWFREHSAWFKEHSAWFREQKCTFQLNLRTASAVPANQSPPAWPFAFSPFANGFDALAFGPWKADSTWKGGI
jgi:hypothetical protein